MAGGAVSPNGDLVAYHSNETGRDEVYIRAFPEPGPAVRVSEGGGSDPVWSTDGSRIYFRNGEGILSENWGGDSLMVASVRRGPEPTVTDVTSLLPWSAYDWPAGMHPVLPNQVP